jgi:hypothetical protein
MTEEAIHLLRLLPPVSRARDFRLYLEGGRRVVDLWQDSGAAILGHKPPNVVRELKNAAERGLFAPLPHRREKRFLKALARLFPGRNFRLYPDESSMRDALKKAGLLARGDEPFPDPVFPDLFEDQELFPRLSLWRPFLPDFSAEVSPATLVPVLPWSLGPRLLALSAGAPDFPESAPLSPVLLTAAARALHDLLGPGSKRGLVSYPKIYPTAAWERRGIYLRLSPPPDGETWAGLFRAFLDGGFLIPPNPREPLILPGDLSPGEEAKLAGLLRTVDR